MYCLNWADFFASTAVDTGFRINFILGIALGNSVYRTFRLAGAAGDTLAIDYARQTGHLPFFLVVYITFVTYCLEKYNKYLLPYSLTGSRPACIPEQRQQNGQIKDGDGWVVT